MQKIAEIVFHRTIVRLFHFGLRSKPKSFTLPPLEWNLKGCKTNTLHTHTEVDCSLQFILVDYAGFF